LSLQDGGPPQNIKATFQLREKRQNREYRKKQKIYKALECPENIKVYTVNKISSNITIHNCPMLTQQTNTTKHSPS
jgi:hypothetical protein